MNHAVDLSIHYPSDVEIDARIATTEEELLCDFYCGGGGASEGIEQHMGRPIDIAVNHDKVAISMHKVNHPYTRHYNESIWAVDPIAVTFGKSIGVAWFSPDCRHFSKAKGGKPVSKSVRGLAWVVLKWAGLKRPRVIELENVPEFKTWGPLTRSGKVIKERKGETFNKWLGQLEALGYVCEFREVQCSRWGVPTDRTRLFMVARCDGEPIVWPMDTHGEGLKPKKSTAEHVIDWSDLGSSIFERKKPLVDNTLKRIANGMEKFVFTNAEPFILRIGQTGWGGDGQTYSIHRPLTTVTTKTEHCLVTPVIGRHFRASDCQSIEQPLATVTQKNKSSLISAILGDKIEIANMIKFRGTNDGADMNHPLPTISSQGNHHALAITECVKVGDYIPAQEVHHIKEVRAFLLKYYGGKSSDNGHDINKPLDSVTSKARFGLVVVEGELHQIIDIKFRMLQPHELYAAHMFPDRYTFTHDIKGNKITKTKQVAMCGNSVPPEMSRRLTESNYSATRNYMLSPIKQFKRGK